MKEWHYQCKTPKPTVCPHCGTEGYISSAAYYPDADFSTEEGRKAVENAHVHIDHRCCKCKQRVPPTYLELVEVDVPDEEKDGNDRLPG
jgi:hypothetical protein